MCVPFLCGMAGGTRICILITFFFAWETKKSQTIFLSKNHVIYACIDCYKFLFRNLPVVTLKKCSHMLRILPGPPTSHAVILTFCPDLTVSIGIPITGSLFMLPWSSILLRIVDLPCKNEKNRLTLPNKKYLGNKVRLC